ncbi:MAG: hypothetical protein K0S29_415 [Gammaproteobacteria bacterium]|jgi:hypothetical protein|nr:hypothetical protein [Gammaproteobacteria bacterium]
MKTLLDSLQAIGVDIWLPFSSVPAQSMQYGLVGELKASSCLVLLAAEDYENWQELQELLSNILKWQKLDLRQCCLAVQNSLSDSKNYSFQELLNQVQAKSIISFGVPIRLELDSHPEIRYVETLSLTRVHNNVENKRRVMNDFAGFSH